MTFNNSIISCITTINIFNNIKIKNSLTKNKSRKPKIEETCVINKYIRQGYYNNLNIFLFCLAHLNYKYIF